MFGRGLKATPKQISPMWLYDSRGSRLFDAITRRRRGAGLEVVRAWRAPPGYALGLASG